MNNTLQKVKQTLNKVKKNFMKILFFLLWIERFLILRENTIPILISRNIKILIYNPRRVAL